MDSESISSDTPVQLLSDLHEVGPKHGPIGPDDSGIEREDKCDDLLAVLRHLFRF